MMISSFTIVRLGPRYFLASWIKLYYNGLIYLKQIAQILGHNIYQNGIRALFPSIKFIETIIFPDSFLFSVKYSLRAEARNFTVFDIVVLDW